MADRKNGKCEPSPLYDALRKHLNLAFFTLPTAKEKKLYRETKLSRLQFSKPFDFKNMKENIGKTFELDSFASFSAVKREVEQFSKDGTQGITSRTPVCIRLLPSKKEKHIEAGIDISLLSNNRSEAEVLLSPNERYQITKIKKDSVKEGNYSSVDVGSHLTIYVKRVSE